jgi:hypothetical protein
MGKMYLLLCMNAFIASTDKFLHFLFSAIHFVKDLLLLPDSIGTDIYTIIERSEPDLAAVIAESSAIEVFSSRSPVTVFLPPFSTWDSNMPEELIDDVLLNHAFDGLLFADELLDMGGQSIASINGKIWQLVVSDGMVSIESDGSGSVPVVMQSTKDTLAMNGVVHYVNTFLVDTTSSTSAPSTTSMPNSISDNETTAAPAAQPTSSSVAPNLDDTSTPVPNSLSDNETTIAPAALPTAAPASSSVDEPTAAPASADLTTFTPTSLQSTAVPDLVTVNAFFVLYNLRGLDSESLASQENGVILTKAFYDFVSSLIAEVEGSRERRLLRSRRLVVSLQPGSPEIFAVLGVSCPASETIPSSATCHNVYGRYNLTVVDEELEAIFEKYSNATKNALMEGKLQESLDKTDPDFPFASTFFLATYPPVSSSDSDDKMAWWLILIIVLACLLMVCLIGGLCVYITTPRKKATSDEENEATVKFLDGDEEKPNVDASNQDDSAEKNKGGTSDGSSNSNFWEETEGLLAAKENGDAAGAEEVSWEDGSGTSSSGFWETNETLPEALTPPKEKEKVEADQQERAPIENDFSEDESGSEFWEQNEPETLGYKHSYSEGDQADQENDAWDDEDDLENADLVVAATTSDEAQEFWEASENIAQDEGSKAELEGDDDDVPEEFDAAQTDVPDTSSDGDDGPAETQPEMPDTARELPPATASGEQAETADLTHDDGTGKNQGSVNRDDDEDSDDQGVSELQAELAEADRRAATPAGMSLGVFSFDDEGEGIKEDDAEDEDDVKPSSYRQDTVCQDTDETPSGGRSLGVFSFDEFEQQQDESPESTDAVADVKPLKTPVIAESAMQGNECSPESMKEVPNEEEGEWSDDPVDGAEIAPREVLPVGNQEEEEEEEKDADQWFDSTGEVAVQNNAQQSEAQALEILSMEMGDENDSDEDVDWLDEDEEPNPAEEY